MVCSQLRHPHVLSYFGTYKEGNDVYMVTEVSIYWGRYLKICSSWIKETYKNLYKKENGQQKN